MRQIFLVMLCLGLLSGLVPDAVVAVPARQAPPRPINVGQPVEGELNDVQQALQYVFDAEAGQNISLLMQTTSGDLDAFLSLATFDGETLTTDDNSGNGTDALIQFTVANAGTYVVTASRSRSAENGGGSGAFTLALSVGQLEVETLEVGPRIAPIVRGTPVQGALTQDARFVLYWFEGRADENLLATPDPGTSLQPLLVLYDARFTEITRNAAGQPLAASLPATDLYFLVVALPDGLSQPGNYALTLSAGETAFATPEPRDVSPGQNRIAYNESLRGVINNTVAAYTFQFTGSAGDEVVIEMNRAGGDLDSYLFLLDSGGVTLQEDDNSGGDNGNARIEATLPADGDYLILATRRGQDSGTTLGNFLLNLRSDAAPVPTAPPPPNPNADGLPEIRIGETMTGEINDLNILSPYRLRARAGDELVITLAGQDGLDPYLVLLRANQEPLAENDDYQPNVNRDAQIETTISEDGTYIVVATRFEQDAGESAGLYALTVTPAGESGAATTEEGREAGQDEGFVQRLGAERLTSGATPTGAFAPLAFANTYAFSITGGDLVDFSVSTDNTQATTIIMTDDRLQPIAATDGGTLLGVPLPGSGTYLFFVAPADGPAQPSNENYIVAFNATGGEVAGPAPDPDATAEVIEEDPAQTISYGEAVTGSINDANPEDDYLFQAVANDTIRISMAAAPGSQLDTFIELYDADDNLISQNDDILPGQNRNSILQTTLPEDGTYRIRATRYTGETAPISAGPYELALEFIEPEAVGISPTVTPIAVGQSIINNINDDQRLLFYSFEANSGDLATIEVERLSGDLDAVLYVYTYTSAGQPIELARNDDSLLGGTFDPYIEDMPLPRAGTYLVGVGRFPEGDSSGEFSLTVTLNQPGMDQ